MKAFCIATVSLAAMLSASTSAAEMRDSASTLKIMIDDAVVLGEADLRTMTFGSDIEAMRAFQNNVISLKEGEGVQLEVELADPGGKAFDVTCRPGIRFESLSPWRIHVTPGGLVTLDTDAAPPRGFGASIIGDNAVQISYGSDDTGAWNKIFFRIER